jgi:hypothetical protein
LYQSALSLAKSFDISDSMSRRGGRQTTKANRPAETPKQYWRISLYYRYPFLDNFIHVSLNRKAASITQHLLPRALTATIYEAYQADIYWSLEDFRREVARWRTRWVITKCNDLPTTLCTTLDSVNQVLYPSIDTILIKLCVLSTMPVASATVERSFSVQRCLKNYVRSIMKNDRLSSLGLVHIHREFEVDLYKAMEVFVSYQTRREDFGQF